MPIFSSPITTKHCPTTTKQLQSFKLQKPIHYQIDQSVNNINIVAYHKYIAYINGKLEGYRDNGDQNNNKYRTIKNQNNLYSNSINIYNDRNNNSPINPNNLILSENPINPSSNIVTPSSNTLTPLGIFLSLFILLLIIILCDYSTSSDKSCLQLVYLLTGTIIPVGWTVWELNRGGREIQEGMNGKKNETKELKGEKLLQQQQQQLKYKDDSFLSFKDKPSQLQSISYQNRYRKSHQFDNLFPFAKSEQVQSLQERSGVQQSQQMESCEQSLSPLDLNLNARLNNQNSLRVSNNKVSNVFLTKSIYSNSNEPNYENASPQRSYSQSLLPHITRPFFNITLLWILQSILHLLHPFLKIILHHKIHAILRAILTLGVLFGAISQWFYSIVGSTIQEVSEMIEGIQGEIQQKTAENKPNVKYFNEGKLLFGSKQQPQINKSTLFTKIKTFIHNTIQKIQQKLSQSRKNE